MIRRNLLPVPATVGLVSMLGVVLATAELRATVDDPGAVGSQAHLFYKLVKNTDLVARRLFDMNELVGAEAKSPKRVLLSFAAKDCRPCREELTQLAAMKTNPFEARGTEFAVVLIDRTKEDAQQMVEFTKTIDLRHPVVWDGPGQIIARKYGVESLPHVVLVGEDGRIQWRKTGYSGQRSIRAMVDQLDHRFGRPTEAE